MSRRAATWSGSRRSGRLAILVAAAAGCWSGSGAIAPHTPGRIAGVEATLVGESGVCRREELRLTDGGRVHEYYIRTPHSPPGPVPAVFLLAGFETGRSALDLLDERDDLVLVSMDYPFAGSKQISGLGLVGALPALRRMGFDTLAAGSVAMDYLSQHPAVDRDRIVLLGVSFGSVFVTALGALDRRPGAVVLIYGGSDLSSLVRNVLRERERWLPGWLVPPLVHLFFGPFEPLDHVEKIAPRPLLMINSRHDELVLPPTAFALYEQAKEPKKLVWYETGHMDLFDPTLIRRLTQEVMAELRRIGVFPARPGL